MSVPRDVYDQSRKKCNYCSVTESTMPQLPKKRRVAAHREAVKKVRRARASGTIPVEVENDSDPDFIPEEEVWAVGSDSEGRSTSPECEASAWEAAFWEDEGSEYIEESDGEDLLLLEDGADENAWDPSFTPLSLYPIFTNPVSLRKNGDRLGHSPIGTASSCCRRWSAAGHIHGREHNNAMEAEDSRQCPCRRGQQMQGYPFVFFPGISFAIISFEYS